MPKTGVTPESHRDPRRPGEAAPLLSPTPTAKGERKEISTIPDLSAVELEDHATKLEQRP